MDYCIQAALASTGRAKAETSVLKLATALTTFGQIASIAYLLFMTYADDYYLTTGL